MSRRLGMLRPNYRLEEASCEVQASPQRPEVRTEVVRHLPPPDALQRELWKMTWVMAKARTTRGQQESPPMGPRRALQRISHRLIRLCHQCATRPESRMGSGRAGAGQGL